MSGNTKAITQVLNQTELLGREEVAKQLLPLVYDDLRDQAKRCLRGERAGHTLQPTALVHEAFLRLVDQNRVNWQGKTHFMAVGAAIMRRVLIDHARTRKRVKRGAAWERVALEMGDLQAEWAPVDALDLHAALEELAALDLLQSQIVELRFFGGLTVEEVAHLLGVSKRKVEGDWTHAKAWLKSRLNAEPPS
jgi:RNA polymerase sigma-70 factor (ECF subfamily)